MTGMLDRLAHLVSMSVVIVAAVGGARAEVKDFGDGDWTIGCDNVRTCIAIGLAPDGADVPAYIKVSRSGEAAAEVSIDVVMAPDGATDDSLRLKLAFDDPAIPGVPATPLAVKKDDDYAFGVGYRTTLAGAPARSLIDGFRRATTMVVTPMSREKAVGTSAVVSLSGAVAALRFMDDRQKRAGTVTALVAKGDKPASAVPAPPPLPVVTVKPIEPLKELPPIPKGLPKPNADDCPEGSGHYHNMSQFLAARLSPSLMLWGVCHELSSYDQVVYRLYLVGDDKVAEAQVEPPPGAQTAAVIDPYFPAADTMSSFAKARAIGDCGASATWAWDGAGFRLLSASGMGHCRSVDPRDWPVSYRAEKR